MPTNTWTSTDSSPTIPDNWNGTGDSGLAVWSLNRIPIDGDDVIITGAIGPDPTVAPLLPVTLNSLDTTGLTDPSGFDNVGGPGNITPTLTIQADGSLAIGSSINVHFWSGDASAAGSAHFDSGFNNGTVCSGATFSTNSENNGTVSGNAAFSANSQNNGTVNGNCAYTSGASGNGATIGGNETLDGNSNSSDNVTGNVIIGITPGDASTYIGGTIGGTATFNYNTGTMNGGPVVTGLATFNDASALLSGTYSSIVWNSTSGSVNSSQYFLGIGNDGSANTFTASKNVTIDFGLGLTFPKGVYIADDLIWAVTNGAVISGQIGSQLVQIYPAPSGGSGGAGRQTMGISI